MSGNWTAPPGWRALRRPVFAAKGRFCWYGGRPANTIDHVRPRVLSGTHELANLVHASGATTPAAPQSAPAARQGAALPADAHFPALVTVPWPSGRIASDLRNAPVTPPGRHQRRGPPSGRIAL